MFFKKEKEVVELIIQHADAMEACVLTAFEAVEAYLNENVPEAKRLGLLVGQHESNADAIRHQIRDKMYLGAYMPLLREDIHKLVESMDKVANAGEACCDFFLNMRPAIGDEFKPQFHKAVKTSQGIAKALKNAVLCFLKGECPIEVARHEAKIIGDIESEVDNIEWDLTKRIFKSNLDYGHKIHLKLCLNTIVEVSDRAEDAADQLELTTLKAMF